MHTINDSKLHFKNNTSTYQTYKENYISYGFFNRKFTALPKTLFCGVIKTTYHLAKAIFIGIPTAPFDGGDRFCVNIFCIARDFQESFGNIAILFNDCFGKFHVEVAKFEKANYNYYLSKRSEFDKMRFKKDSETCSSTSSSDDPSSTSASSSDDFGFTPPRSSSYSPKYPSNQFSGNGFNANAFFTNEYVRRKLEENIFNSPPAFSQRPFPHAFPPGSAAFFSSQNGPSGFKFGSFNFENPPSPTFRQPVSLRETNYSILGLCERASFKEIKSAYHKLIKQYHPDKISRVPANDYEKRLKEATEKFQKIDRAYKALI